MIDEHTWASLLHLIETLDHHQAAHRRVGGRVAAAGGPPRLLRMDNGAELAFQRLAATVLCWKGRVVAHSAG